MLRVEAKWYGDGGGEVVQDDANGMSLSSQRGYEEYNGEGVV